VPHRAWQRDPAGASVAATAITALRLWRSLGFADPASGVAFAYVINRPGKRFESERTDALLEPLYRSLGASS